MKTLEELQAIREQARQKMTVRANQQDAVRVVVGMATCGIAAGARPVLNAFCGRSRQTPSGKRDGCSNRLHRHVPV